MKNNIEFSFFFLLTTAVRIEKATEYVKFTNAVISLLKLNRLCQKDITLQCQFTFALVVDIIHLE
jgi:hypothetical protein